MADLTRAEQFVNGNLHDAAEVENEFDNYLQYINAKNQGTTPWDNVDATVLKVDGTDVTTWMGYRRPNLSRTGATTIDVENNTGTANQTSILFPDGTIRSVTENTASTHKYRRFTITATAEFITGTEDSGLYTGLSEAANTWYAMYAVKSQIDSSKFVLVGTTTLPLQANYATLNTNLGTDSWVYLGMVRNGDGSAGNSDLLPFNQSGGVTYFTNQVTTATLSSSVVGGMAGIIMATNASATSLTWAYATGTGSAQIPNHLKNGPVNCGRSGGTGPSRVFDEGQGRQYAHMSDVGNSMVPALMPLTQGVRLDVTGTAAALDILIGGFHDTILSQISL